jgi:hypothetical protein
LRFTTPDPAFNQDLINHADEADSNTIRRAVSDADLWRPAGA